MTSTFLPPAHDTKVVPKENIFDTRMEIQEEEEEDTANAPNFAAFSSVAVLNAFSSVASVIATEESRQWAPMLLQMAGVDDDDESDEEGWQWGGSVKGKAANIQRDFDATYKRLVSQYFNGDDSLYTTSMFRRRFRVSPSIFQRVYHQLHGKGVFKAEGTKDALGRECIHPLVRMTAVFRMLAYGTAADSQDENLQISETVAANALRSFCQLLILEFGDEYLNRTPNAAEKKRILEVNAKRGFPGLFASWDCKHFIWDKCPVRLQGQHRGHHAGGKHTKILEAIADDSCYFWFINFGDPGSLNDINVLDKSSIVGALIQGLLDIKCDPYILNGTVRDWMYFLADGIYPEWTMFVKTIPYTARHNPREKFFAARQEAVRKDVERAFGILVKKFHILAKPIRLWDETEIRNLIYACVILHNMCCEERLSELYSVETLSEEDHMRYFDPSETDPTANNPKDSTIFAKLPVLDNTEAQYELEVAMNLRFARATRLHYDLVDPQKHLDLKNDLIAYLQRRI